MPNAKRSWKRIVPLAVTAVLLLAVPASALTFLTPWQFAQTKQEKGAPTALFDPTFGDGETLLVDMGATSSPKAKSRVEASREFRVDSGDNLIGITHMFETLLVDASLKVEMKLKPEKGFKLKSVKGDGQLVGLNQTFVHTLPQGDYTLKIKIDYKNKNGGWDNSAPAPGSPHTFSIQSI
jgi:hypothetical protein